MGAHGFGWFGMVLDRLVQFLSTHAIVTWKPPKPLHTSPATRSVPTRAPGEIPRFTMFQLFWATESLSDLRAFGEAWRHSH